MKRIRKGGAETHPPGGTGIFGGAAFVVPPNLMLHTTTKTAGAGSNVIFVTIFEGTMKKFRRLPGAVTRKASA